MEVPELTKDGHRFINNLLEIYRETPSNKHDTVGKLANLKNSGSGNYKISGMPVEHPNYGELVTDTSKQYYLKARYPEAWEDIGPARRKEPVLDHEKSHGGKYQNECFGEARIWLEAKERGEEHMELFAPVVDYDGEEFTWNVMLATEKRRTQQRRETVFETDPKELGWRPHDTEYGGLDGRVVAHDYGMWRRKDDEWLVPEEDVFKESY